MRMRWPEYSLSLQLLTSYSAACLAVPHMAVSWLLDLYPHILCSQARHCTQSQDPATQSHPQAGVT